MIRTKVFVARTGILLEQSMNDFIEAQPYFEFVSITSATRGENMMTILVYEDQPSVSAYEPHEIY